MYIVYNPISKETGLYTKGFGVCMNLPTAVRGLATGSYKKYQKGNSIETQCPNDDNKLFSLSSLIILLSACNRTKAQ